MTYCCQKDGLDLACFNAMCLPITNKQNVVSHYMIAWMNRRLSHTSLSSQCWSWLMSQHHVIFLHCNFYSIWKDSLNWMSFDWLQSKTESSVSSPTKIVSLICNFIADWMIKISASALAQSTLQLSCCNIVLSISMCYCLFSLFDKNVPLRIIAHMSLVNCTEGPGTLMVCLA